MKRAGVAWMLVAGACALSGACADVLRTRVVDAFYTGEVVLDDGTLAFDVMRKCAGASTNRVAGRLRVEGAFSACVEQTPTRGGRVFAARRADGTDVRVSFLKGAVRVDGAAVVWDVPADDGFQAAKTGCGFRCTADGTPFLIGLAGVVNAGFGYDELAFSPRWPVTSYTNVRYLTGYEAFGRTVDYRHVRTDAGMRYRVESPAKTIRAHLLLPAGKTPRTPFVNGTERAFSVSRVDASRYLDVVVEPVAGLADFEVLWN